MDYKDFQYEIRGLNTLLNLTQDSIRVFPVKPSEGHIEIKISPLSHTININIDENWQINKDPLLSSYLNKSYHEHPLLEMGRDLLCNNLAHNQICPASLEVHHRLMNIVAKTLKERGKESHCRYVCHAFEDIIANCWCKLNFGNFKGMVIFFYDQLYPFFTSGRVYKSKFLTKLLPAFNFVFSDFYELFVRINLLLWGERDDFYLLERFFTRKKEMKEIQNKIIDILDLKDSVELYDTVEVLCDSSRWEIFAREFSLVTVDLLEDNKRKEKLSCENQFEKEIMDNKDTRKKFIKRMYEKSREKPDYVESVEITKTLYEMLAPEIPIQVTTKKKGRAFPVVPFNYDPFDPEIHSKEDIDLGGVVVDGESPFFHLINFRVPRYYYDISIPYHSQRRGAFPDICFILDTSASMADDVENKISIPTVSMIRQMIRSRFYFGEGKASWSDKSKYHHVLLGFNGAIKWLMSQGIAPYIRYNVITFSRDTLTSGWRDYSELDECKKIAYLPQFDTTVINHRIIKEQLLGREPFVLIILSDGEIFNWDESTKAYSPRRLRDFIRGVKPVKPLFKKIVENNMVSHIQISEGDFKPRISLLTCRDLAQWGAEIYRVNDINTLESLMIRITGKVMSPYLQDNYNL